jgi:hypothetical protein
MMKYLALNQITRAINEELREVMAYRIAKSAVPAIDAEDLAKRVKARLRRIARNCRRVRKFKALPRK